MVQRVIEYTQADKPILPPPYSARKTVQETAKRTRIATQTARAGEKADEKAKKSGAASKTKTKEDSDDDEVEDLDVDVIAAVALRDKISSADGDKKQSLDTKKQKLSKKAAKRAAVRVAREIEEGYAGDGVWEKDGYDVAVAGENSDGRRLGTASAMAFLAKGFGRNKRSGAMLLDPKTGKPLRVGGVAKLGVGKKRK